MLDTNLIKKIKAQEAQEAERKAENEAKRNANNNQKSLDGVIYAELQNKLMKELKFRTTNPNNLTKKQLINLHHNGVIPSEHFKKLYNARVVKNVHNARRTHNARRIQQYRKPIGTLNNNKRTEMNTYSTGKNREMITYKNHGTKIKNNSNNRKMNT